MNTDKNAPEFVEKTFKSLEKLATTPRFSDPDQNRIAEILHTLSSVILLMGIATLILTPFVFTNPGYGLGVTGFIILFIIFIQYLNRKGKTRLASQLFVYSVWIIDTVIIFLSGGFYSDYLAAFITITVMGGLILGGLSAYYFTGLSILTILIFYFLDTQGYMPEATFLFTPVALIIITVVCIVLAASALVLVITKYEATFKELIAKEKSISNTNLELTQEIQARIEAQTLQLQSEERFKSALMESPYPTMLHAENGEIILVNTAWIQKTGYSPTDLLTIEEWVNHSFRENASQVFDEVNQLIQTSQKQREGYYPLYTKHGETRNWYLRWTRLPDLPDGRKLIITMATDMTNMQNIESALRESEENLSKFSLVSNDGIWDWDLLTDQVSFDPLYYTMAGYQVNEFPHLLEEFRKRVHPDDVEHVFKNAEELLAGKSDRFDVEFRFLKKDGTWLWVMGRGEITEQDEDGNPLRFVGTHTDISNLKNVQEELNQYQLQLEDIVEDRTQRLNERISEVERLNTALANILDDYQTANEKLSSMSKSLADSYQDLESFTYSISNDLREPLNAVKESSDLLSKKYLDKLDPQGRKHMQNLQANASLVDYLINDFLKLAQLGRQEIHQEPINTSKLVQEVLNSFSGEIKENNIQAELKELPPCLGDEKLIKMVFHNLISNSIKFTKNKRNPEIIIGYQPDQSSERVIYFVKDNGVGFNMKDKENVYNTFQRLHDREEFLGTSVGLTLAKKIINRHGGEIWAQAKEKEGATLYFDLERSSV